MSDISDRVFQAQVKKVEAMKARGHRPEDILDMEPGLADAVREVFEEHRTDISPSAVSGPDFRGRVAEDLARYIAQHGGGSGSVASPVRRGEEIAV